MLSVEIQKRNMVEYVRSFYSGCLAWLARCLRLVITMLFYLEIKNVLFEKDCCNIKHNYRTNFEEY